MGCYFIPQHYASSGMKGRPVGRSNHNQSNQQLYGPDGTTGRRNRYYRSSGTTAASLRHKPEGVSQQPPAPSGTTGHRYYRTSGTAAILLPHEPEGFR